MNYYEGKKILVIGGTGTIGTRMIKELLKLNPQVVRILSRDEYKQFILAEELKENKNLRFLIGDVRDYGRVERAMDGIDIVFNLAAMKHVPACEYNPTEAVKTNVDGMENVIKAAIYNNVECVVFTSSDKAISPVNAYGATKLLAEKLVQTANYNKGSARTKFVAVRFGNVMGSRGSVFQLFAKQIKEQKTITITNGDMSRFMMTLSQAVNLTLQAAEKSVGGEVFVLKMPVIRLIDLAEVLVEENCKKLGLSPSEIQIKTIGLRPGEKMFEELMTEEEAVYACDLGNMYAVLPAAFTLNSLIENYCNNKKPEVKSYSSHGELPLSKEELRKLIIKEKLV